MLLPYRKYEKEKPYKTAKKIYIFCEGKKREFQYFSRFEEFDSRINIKVVPPEQHDNNSPTGLLNIAKSHLDGLKEKLRGTDEIWFVIDMDTWGDKVDELYDECLIKRWHVAISNPCFEVWLYYHFFDLKPQFEGIEESVNWKFFLNECVPGGFDSKKYFVLIKTAIDNSEQNYSESNNKPLLACTSVFNLGKIIHPFVKEKLER